jgi:hypothetical protein
VTPTTSSNGSPLAGVASDAASAAVDKAKQKIHSILHVP